MLGDEHILGKGRRFDGIVHFDTLVCRLIVGGLHGRQSKPQRPYTSSMPYFANARLAY